MKFEYGDVVRVKKSGYPGHVEMVMYGYETPEKPAEDVVHVTVYENGGKRATYMGSNSLELVGRGF